MEFLTTIILFGIPILGLFFAFIYETTRKSKYLDHTPQTERKMYTLNPKFLTAREASFFNILLPIASKHKLHIFAKPRMADFINLNINFNDNRTEFYRRFNPISQKHIDFLLCDNNFIPIMGFEVDDKTHKNPDRVARDSFVDGIYKYIGLPVHHIWTWNEPETIEAFIINANINKEDNITTAQNIPSKGEISNEQ
ncbi:MAG: DUF2726 domain-containing protein [Defluviitaleaceae bacterium]|nr:DUF2726 domain-containing protein [Defluviitaleaceae bacterium]